MRQSGVLKRGFFLYARREMSVDSAFATRSMRLYASASQGDGPITLHTPPSFTGCFPDRCRSSQPCCAQKWGFLPSLRPPAPPFFRMNASFSPEPTSIFARCSLNKPSALEPVLPGAPASRHTIPSWRSREHGCSVLLCPLLPPRFAWMVAELAV